MVKRRASGEPTAYILGTKVGLKSGQLIIILQEFYGLTYKLNRNTLIPRPETELIIDTTKRFFPTHQKLHICDLGTGSGCILLSLLTVYQSAKGTGVDINPAAITLAKENANSLKLHTRSSFVTSDWLYQVREKSFDLIVSNPPYISDIEYESLPSSVRLFEPPVALKGGKDGLHAYRMIYENLTRYSSVLSTGGMVLLELGVGQLDAVQRIFTQDTLLKYVTHESDLAGHPRVIVFQRH